MLGHFQDNVDEYIAFRHLISSTVARVLGKFARKHLKNYLRNVREL